ncbi:MAG TPA: adenosylcobalamin-dependent ribonucleoside-diphosphate reductase [Candidatus Paceibacterota bacterium]|nr:adenosylcobalamin-dependent ribonucleoside-diphosphate reductase [Candidatus Paceibacterota bacterium]
MPNGKFHNPFRKIKKRDGRVVVFDSSKITEAIFKAAESVGKADYPLAKSLMEEVLRRLGKKLKIQRGYIPSIEEIQDTVEQVLIDRHQAEAAKAYILYRQKRSEIRKEKAQILNKETIDEVDKRFDLNALRVLASRYLRKDTHGNVVESPKELFTRVSVHTALPSLFYDEAVLKKRGRTVEHRFEEFSPEKFDGKFKIGNYILNQFHLEGLKRLYDRFNREQKLKLSWSKFLEKLKDGYFDKHAEEIEKFYNLMVSRKFMPNTPALANFGSVFGMGSACFVLDVEDSIDSIMDTLKAASVIFKSGGGVGYNFSKLRPEGDFVRSTGGFASGPISFMSLYDRMTEVIKQGGIRRGANMGILNINHPDIEAFIRCKTGNQAMRNFNLSVLVLPEFWQYYREHKPYPMINPHTNQVAKYADPRKILDLVAYQAWESAEPGVIFYDRINEYNPLVKALGPITCTNPCGEVLLYPYESCNLGSINLWAFVKPNHKHEKKFFDWQEFSKTVELAARFMDNVIDINKYPLPQIEEMTLKTRKMGLGVMGLADTLFELMIPYNSSEGLKFMERMTETLNYYTKHASVNLSEERGRFTLFDKSFYPDGKMPFAGYKDKKSWHFDWQALVRKIKTHGLRNAFTTVLAPTGSISMIAGCSSGIEPNYSLVFEKNVAVGSFYYVNPVFERILMRFGLFNDYFLRRVINNDGSVNKMNSVPVKLKKVLVTAMDISPEDHIRALGAMQKWIDSSISKTNNLPFNATPEDIKSIYLLAYKLGCKDVTVFRDKSIKNQVLVAGNQKNSKKKPKDKEGVFVSKKDTKAEGFSIYYQPSLIESLPMEAKNLVDEKKFCPNCHTELVNQEKCHACPVCGWGVCS